MRPIRVRTLTALSFLGLLAAAGCERNYVTYPLPPVGTFDRGDIATFAGAGIAGYNGDNLKLTNSWFYWPDDVYVRQTSSGAEVWVVDWNNFLIRRVAPGSNTLQTVAGAASIVDGSINSLNHPTNISFRGDTLLIVAWHNHSIRLMKPGATDGRLDLLWGALPPGYGGNGNLARFGRMNLPSSMAWGPDSAVFISDQGNRRIRIVNNDAPDLANRTIDLFAGTGAAGFGGDGGPAVNATFNASFGTQAVPSFRLAVSPDLRWLYIADSFNNRVRKIDLQDSQHTINTVAGSGDVFPDGSGGGYSGDGGPGTSARLNNPTDVEVDDDGSVYIADCNNHVIRKLATDGTITTLAGTGIQGFSGDNGPAASARLFHPEGLALDRVSHILYVADRDNQRIRMIKL